MEQTARHEMKQAAAKAPWMGQQEAAEAVLKMERLQLALMETDNNGTLHQRHPLSPLFKNVTLIEAYCECLRDRRSEYWRTGSTGRFHEPLLETDSAFKAGFVYKPDSNEVRVSPATIQFVSTISQRLDAVSVPFFLGEVLRGMFSAMSILGSTVDSNGDLHQWWSSETKERFMKRAKCFQNSFADAAILYVKEGLRDESLFMEDNVVDGAVLRPLYNIHERLARESPMGDFIQGLPRDLDPKKLFFINWASTFCEPEQNETAVRERLRFKMSVASRIRLNVALSQFPPFSGAFSCPAGSAMNQSKACSFW
ncbi:hypothetical protein HPB48_014688 [Haemaphysalis longicornis]|uniref:Peptidase M13 C-terminal domain-containing protein n=1 Tax=Haemaphysalis longicornis TaxID=44386 RepID=A0A9J6G983_HAELO|nr:hypothetical protein HPB48_014688 [Haemaphysalis longicornis]